MERDGLPVGPTDLTESPNDAHVLDQHTLKPLINQGTEVGHQINSLLLLGQVRGFTRRPSHQCTCTKDVLECRCSPPPFPL